MNTQFLNQLVSLTASLALLVAPRLSAATNNFYFNSSVSTNGLIIFGGYSGGGYWQLADGSPNDPEAAGSPTNGYFVLTDAVNGQFGGIVFPDFDSGRVVESFRFTCDVRIGAGTDPPADGFSICYARPDDPSLNDFVAEEGTQTGVAVCFDAYNNGSDVVGLTLKIDGEIVTNIQLPYLNLAPSDPHFAASIQTGTGGAGLADLTWQPLAIEYTGNGLLNVAYKGATLLTNYGSSFSPSAGRWILGGRTGGLNENHHIDNIRIVTTPALPPRAILRMTRQMDNQLVLSWTNALFQLQCAPTVTGPFTNLPGATSPWTNPITGTQQFYRLIAN